MVRQATDAIRAIRLDAGQIIAVHLAAPEKDSTHFSGDSFHVANLHADIDVAKQCPW